MTLNMFQNLYDSTMDNVIHLLYVMELSYVQNRSFFYQERGRSWNKFSEGVSMCQNRVKQYGYCLRINKDTHLSPIYQKHQPQEPRQPLKPTPAPE